MKNQGKGRDPVSANEIPLFVQAQAGCSSCLDELMRRHDGLVQAVVRQQVLGQLPFLEALQAGRMGLWRAILGFDPQRGLAFSTYAWPAIMRSIWRAVKRQQRRATRLDPALLPPPQDPALLVEERLVQETLLQMIDHLPPRLRGIMVAYYGLEGQPPASYRQLVLDQVRLSEWWYDRAMTKLPFLRPLTDQ